MKHQDCADRCQLQEHKGYDTCERSGVCAEWLAEQDRRYNKARAALAEREHDEEDEG